MAWLSDADQNRLSLPRLDSRGAAGARSGPVHGSGAALRYEGNSGVALFLLQGAHDSARSLPGARHFHPADEAQEYAALDERQKSDHAPRSRILRLSGVAWRGPERCAFS